MKSSLDTKSTQNVRLWACAPAKEDGGGATIMMRYDSIRTMRKCITPPVLLLIIVTVCVWSGGVTL